MSDAAIGWTDDRVELLSKLWGEGLSASQIAAQLGGGVTRNAVIGKVHRLGLSGRAKPGAAAAVRQAKPRALPGAPQLEGGRTPPRDSEQLMRPTQGGGGDRWDVEQVAIPESQRVSIMELRDTMCRWPLGDPSKPDFAFCGGRAVGGLPYCGHHCRIAYQPAAERRRLRA
jgi:GcrA cell cycle regulator